MNQEVSADEIKGKLSMKCMENDNENLVDLVGDFTVGDSENAKSKILHINLKSPLESNKKYIVFIDTVKSEPFSGEVSAKTQTLAIPTSSIKLKPLRKLLATCVRFRHNGDMSVKE